MEHRRTVDATFRVIGDEDAAKLESLSPQDRDYLQAYMKAVANAFRDIDKRLSKIEKVMKLISDEYTES